MRLYILAPSVFVLVIFYLPLVLWMLSKVWRSGRWRGGRRIGVLFLTAFLAYVVPLGDVTVNSIAMAKVCPRAGLHIYKTVETDGYITYLGDATTLKKYPYKYIETPQLKSDGTYCWNHYEREADGEVSQSCRTQPVAEYELALVEWHSDVTRGVESSSELIRSRKSGAVLAEKNLFNPLPGWLDRILVVRWFGTGGRRGCWGKPSGMIDVTKILIPKQSKTDAKDQSIL